MSRLLLKLRLILWKNFIIRRRHWLLTIFEIGIPIALCIINLYLTSVIQKDYNPNTTYYAQNDLHYDSAIYLYYTPNNSYVEDFMTKIKFSHQKEFEGFTTENDMIDYMNEKVRNTSYYMNRFDVIGVVFEDFTDSFPKQLKYKLRAYMDEKYGQLFPDFSFDGSDGHYNEYIDKYPFTSVQKALDMAFIEHHSGDNLQNYNLMLQKMPYPPHKNNLYTILIRELFPVMTYVGFLFLFLSVLKRVIEEKSTGIKELMKMMGLQSWMSWVGWFTYSMVFNLIPITVISILYKYGLTDKLPPILINGNAFLVWVLLFLYCISLICFLFATSTLFKKPTLGTSVGLIVWIFLGFIGDRLVTDQTGISDFVRGIFNLVPNNVLKLGYSAIIQFEKGEGINFSNVWTIPNKYLPHPSLGLVYLILIGDSLLFLIFTWYIENVFPGEFGVGKPWYFPFTKSYWVSNKITDEPENFNSIDERPEIEKASSDMVPGIQLRNLHKSFSGRPVVKGLGLDIYQNQITVLLGHNGAGKTTTMNMITGITAPSKGIIVVNGYDIYKNMDTVRKSLGLCPQFDVQFTDLTVIQHLMFFAMLRGHGYADAIKESEELLTKLNLHHKKNVMAGELSGGMRRKLSLAMATVGSSEILILDEPTSGLDPEARREIWDFLLNMRGRRTILITTHYMEEADILGDRIAIMHDGSLKCYGSTLFLKKHYGTGYILNVLVASEYDLEKLNNGITKYINSATVKTINANCVTYNLPSNDTTALSNLFINLEKNKIDLNISTFGVSITTMEEVFLRVGELADELDKASNGSGDETKHLLTDSYSENLDATKIKSKPLLIMQQFKGLLLKRIQYSIRKWITFIVQLLIPIAFIILALILTTGKNDDKNGNDIDIKMNLELNKYKSAHVFYSYDPETAEYANKYTTLVEKQKALIESTPSVSDSVIEVGKKNMDDYERSLIVSAEFNSTSDGRFNLNGMYGSLAIHGPPIALNLLTNTLLQSLKKSDEYSISVTNNPIQYHADAMTTNILGSYEKAINWMFMIPLGFTIMIGLFIIFPQEERLTGVLHLQIMSGVSRAVYWLSNFFFDLIIYIVVLIIMLILVVSFDSGGAFGNGKSLGALSILLLMYALGVLPFAYIFTYRRSAAGNMSLLVMAQILIGGVGALVIVALLAIDNEDDKIKRDIAMYFLYIVPQFAFGIGIFTFTKHAAEIETFKTSNTIFQNTLCQLSNIPCCDKQAGSAECQEWESFFGSDKGSSLNTPLLFLFGHFIVYSALLLFLETGIPRKYFEKLKDLILRTKMIDENLQEDVIDEKKRVDEQLKGHMTDVLIAKNLKKWYGKSVYAARDLNFGVKSGECFGLLGVNGAGKTTTFKMLTGDIPASEGESFINNLSILRNKSEYLKNIGYCPQFDALNFTLTGKQMLTLFAYIRGVQEKKIRSEVEKWLYRCGIKQYENIVCRKYSGGNKRKLSTAVALIGNPPLIMMDEPTCGVDPVARRKLWDVLATIRKEHGQSIVLTTHSMEECEALCERLAIMVDGQFKCIGNIQTLKSKFGQGFTVVIKLMSSSKVTESDIGDLKLLIQNKFSCSLKDQHMGMLHYHINPINTSIGEIFGFMEEMKKNHKFVEDYTVNDTSLEEVFLSFAKTKSPTSPIGVNMSNMV